MSDAKPAPNKRILLVEDNQVTATVYQRMLQREGYEVVHAAAGNEALSALKDEKFDLILLDLMLPDVDGIEILKRTRDGQETFETPVVVLSEVDLNLVREEVRRYGVKEFFTKTGADAAKIIAEIRKLVAPPPHLSLDDDASGPTVQFAKTETLTSSLKMAPAKTLNVRKRSQVCRDPLDPAAAPKQQPQPVAATAKPATPAEPVTVTQAPSRRRFLFLW